METWLNTEQCFRSTHTEHYASTRNNGLTAAMTTESFLRADAKTEGYRPKSMCTHTARVLEATSRSVAREDNMLKVATYGRNNYEIKGSKGVKALYFLFYILSK